MWQSSRRSFAARASPVTGVEMLSMSAQHVGRHAIPEVQFHGCIDNGRLRDQLRFAHKHIVS